VPNDATTMALSFSTGGGTPVDAQIGLYDLIACAL
jgi:hypothetical protein